MALYADTQADTPKGRTPALTLDDRVGMLEADSHAAKNTRRNLARHQIELTRKLDAFILDLREQRERLDEQLQECWAALRGDNGTDAMDV